MDSDTKKHLTEQGTWKRIAYMVLFVITFNIAEIVMFAIMVVQAVFKLLTGKPLDSLVDLGEEIGTYLRSVVNFLTFASEEMPFPVSSWPGKSGSGSKPEGDQSGGGPINTTV